MDIIALVLTGLVGLLHVYFCVLEMFLWEKPIGLKTFRNTPEKAAETKVLAANQGLYNGFLAAGLLWGVLSGEDGTALRYFFLSCVLIAGVYGAATASKKILYVQALPALVALAAVWVSTLSLSG